MAVLKSRPKGLHEILYPLPDIRLRFVNNTNEGEIIFRDNKWIFDPPIQIGAIQVAELEQWDPDIAYQAGDTYVSYAYDGTLAPEGDEYYSEYIYRCIIDTNKGESPFMYPEKWLRLAKVGSESDGTAPIIQISNVYGLEEILNNTVNITDFGDQFIIDPTTGQISLNIDYITVNDYSPAQDIVPEEPDPEVPSSGEIRINNTVWKIHNEMWTDGGEGIYSPRLDFEVLADPQIYGYLYNQPAIIRLLAANPGYRLPTLTDFKDSFDQYIEAGKLDPSMYPLFTADNWQVDTSGVPGWEELKALMTNSSGVSLVSPGQITLTQDLSSLYNLVRAGIFSGAMLWGAEGMYIAPISTWYGGSFNWVGVRYITSDAVRITIDSPNNRYNTMCRAVRLVKDI